MSLYCVLAEKLNVRKTPSTSSEIISRLEQDTPVWGIQDPIDGWLEIDFRGNQKAWVSSRYLTPIQSDFPRWLRIAVQELGVKEYAGQPDNPHILEYLKTTTLGAPYNSNDETPWCSSFANWCMEKAGLRGTDNAMARSWLNWGEKLDTPRLGCVVVFSRPPDPTAGHVAFYVSETPTHIKVLGGNQGDEVNVSLYPKERLLGYRWKA